MNHDQLFIDMALGAWNTYVQRVNKFLAPFSEEELDLEVAPGKNRISYLLGHLVAIHDKLMELLEMGQRSHADLDQPFIAQPDRAVSNIPDAKTLLGYWNKQNEELPEKFKTLTISDWFNKHTAVSAEDFAKDPTRNKLNVLINRTNHMAYHYGQLQLVRKS